MIAFKPFEHPPNQRGKLSKRLGGNIDCKDKTRSSYILVLHEIAADPMIVSEFVYLHDAPKSKVGRPREEGTLEMIRRVVWMMLYADGTGVVSTSSRGLARMMDGIVVTCQGFARQCRRKRPRPCTCGPIPAHRRTRCKLRWHADGVNKQPNLCILVGTISESTDLNDEIKRRVGAT